MIELLQNFSLSNILIFTVLLILALKASISMYDWFTERGINLFKKKYTKPKELENCIHELVATVEKLNNKVDVLMDSDKDDIKAFIVREHHYFCYQIGEIDYQSLQVIERRYTHYKDQGGNSYVQDLMQDLRALPKTKEMKSRRKIFTEREPG